MKTGECAINELILIGNRFARLLVLNSAPVTENWIWDTPSMTLTCSTRGPDF
jgi:hypothetical protein